MLPQGCAVEAPHNQVVVYVVPGLQYSEILKQTEVCPKDVVCPVPLLLTSTEHTPRLSIPHIVVVTRY